MHVIFGGINICPRVLLFITHICNNTHWVASMDFRCLRDTRTRVSGYRTRMRKNRSISNDEVTKYYDMDISISLSNVKLLGTDSEHGDL